jgi:hypothetical protein
MSSNPVPFQWQEVDSTLANPMLLDLSLEIRELIQQDEQQIRFLNIGNENSATEPSQRLHMQLLRSDEWAARTYDLYCEVWRRQRRVLSPQFLRAVSQNAIRTLVSARVSAVTSELRREQHRTGRHNSEWLNTVTASFSQCLDPDIVLFTSEGDYRGRNAVMKYFRECYFGQTPKVLVSIAPRERHLIGGVIWIEYDMFVTIGNQVAKVHGTALYRKGKERWLMSNMNYSVAEQMGMR